VLLLRSPNRHMGVKPKPCRACATIATSPVSLFPSHAFTLSTASLACSTYSAARRVRRAAGSGRVRCRRSSTRNRTLRTRDLSSRHHAHANTFTMNDSGIRRATSDRHWTYMARNRIPGLGTKDRALVRARVHAIPRARDRHDADGAMRIELMTRDRNIVTNRRREEQFREITTCLRNGRGGEER
jgi:hypothetical protein